MFTLTNILIVCAISTVLWFIFRINVAKEEQAEANRKRQEEFGSVELTEPEKARYRHEIANTRARLALEEKLEPFPEYQKLENGDIQGWCVDMQEWVTLTPLIMEFLVEKDADLRKLLPISV